MSKLFEAKGIKAKCVSFELGLNNKGQPEVRATMEIVEDGPHKGVHVPYSGKFTQTAIKYTRRDLTALGWQGKNIDTSSDDIMKSPKEVPIDVEIASFTYEDSGKRREWSTVRSIGRPQAEPLKPLDKQMTMDVQQWLTEAAREESTDDPPFR